jgi:hypothetical protein
VTVIAMGDSFTLGAPPFTAMRRLVLTSEDTTDDQRDERDLISEAQARPSPTSTTDHRRTSQIVPICVRSAHGQRGLTEFAQLQGIASATAVCG